MKPYTRTGDSGQTGLFGGKRVGKHTLRIEAYGTVDELNSLLGYAKTWLNDKELTKILEKVQADLFIVGGDLATPLDAGTRVGKKTIPRVTADMTKELEKITDGLAENLPLLKSFILPGGCSGGALLHFCRSVARRAERRVVALSSSEKINRHVVPYLNRLSSLLFVFARKVNLEEGVEEQPWQYRASVEK